MQMFLVGRIREASRTRWHLSRVSTSRWNGDLAKLGGRFRALEQGRQSRQAEQAEWS